MFDKFKKTIETIRGTASPTLTFESIAALADGLIRAKEAHTEYERAYGPDANWPLWYASYLAMEQGLTSSPFIPKPCSGPQCIPAMAALPPQIKSAEVDLGKFKDSEGEGEYGEEEYWDAHDHH
jgi:hypothetical protein